MNENKRYPATLNLTFDIVFCVVAVPQMLFFALWLISKTYEEIAHPHFHVYICLVTLIFLLSSTIRLAVVYDKQRREMYLQNEKQRSFKSDICFMIRQKSLWLRAGVIALIYIALPIDWSFTALAIIFTNKLVALAVLFPSLILITVFSNLSAYKHWRRKPKSKYENKEYSKEAVIIGIYAIGGMAVAMVFPIFRMFSSLWRELPVVKIIIVTLCVIVVFWCYRFVNAYLKRRSCIKQLEQLCMEKEYDMSEIKKPYLSIFKFYDEESFNVAVGDKKYSCKFVSSIRKNNPLLIHSNGELTYIYEIRLFKVKLFSFTTTHRPTYETNSKKILILNPTPKHVYKVCDGTSVLIDSGDSVGNYKIFTASRFLRALELDLLDK